MKQRSTWIKARIGPLKEKYESFQYVDTHVKKLEKYLICRAHGKCSKDF